MQRQLETITAELGEARAELQKAKLAAGDAAAMDEEMKRQMEEQLQTEKLKRIEHTKQMAMRRIGKRELTRGWETWYGMYWQQVRERQMLRAAGARLAKPKLFACVKHWRDDWREETRYKETMSITDRLHHDSLEREMLRSQVMWAQDTSEHCHACNFDKGVLVLAIPDKQQSILYYCIVFSGVWL